MKSLEEIKLDFEHRNYGHRTDFIDEYDFNDDYKEYYKDFLLKADNIKNHLYLSELIDLAAYLEIFDQKLYERYFSYLFENKHYIIKLAVLDYLIDSDKFYKDIYSEEKLREFLERKQFSILKNQCLLNLIALSTKNEEKYIEELITSLSRTEDWRSIYRTLNIINLKLKLEKIKDLIFRHVDKLSEYKDFGDGVKKLLCS